MALIVEDGSGVSGAESLISVVDADTYHNGRGNATWLNLTTTEKEEALRKSTDYMESRYSAKWLGYLVSSTQALSWPRDYVPIVGAYVTEYYASDTIPTQVKNACAEYAVRSSAADLLPDGEKGAIKRKKVDVLETEYASYNVGSNRYKQADTMLSNFVIGLGGVLPMIRV